MTARVADVDPFTLTFGRPNIHPCGHRSRRLARLAQHHDGTRITWQSLAEVPLKGVDLDDEAFIDSLLDAE